MRVRIAVGPLGEVAVERRDDRVRTLVVFRMAVPLADARPAGIGHHRAADRQQIVQQPVALGRLADLLRSGIDNQLGFCLQPFRFGLPGDAGRAAQVLIGRVRARADQSHFHLPGIALFAHDRSEIGDRVRCVGRERPVDMRLERRQVDVDHPVVIFRGVGSRFGIRDQVGGDPVGQRGYLLAPGGAQVAGHRLVVRKQRGRCPDLGAHVTDRRLARSRKRGRSFAEVLDHGIRTALDGQQAGELQDHVLGRGPTAQLARKTYADDLRHLQFPRHAGHHVHGVGSADADRDHAQSSGIRRVRIGPDHHAARESVIFEHDLVDDARSRAPESESVAVRHAAKEVVHLAIRLVGRPQVVRCAPVGQNQVVAMDRGGNRRTVAAGVHELQQSHLGRSVLHGDPVGAEVHIVLASAERSGRRGVEQVGVQDFFGQCQRSAFGGARAFHLFAERAVDGPDQFDVKLHDITGFKILKPGIPVRRRSDSSGRLPRNAGVLRNADVDNAKINILLKNILSARYFSRMAENLGPFAVACLDDERNQLVGLLAADDESVFVNVFDQYQILALGGVDLVQVPLPEAEIVAEVAPESVAAQQRP